MDKINMDHFAIWGLAGVLGIMVRDLYSYLAGIVGIAEFYIWNVGARIFVEGKEVTSILGNLLGFLTDFTIGGTLGVIIGATISATGRKHYLLKGWGIGQLAWLFLFGLVFHNLPNTMDAAPTNALSNVSAFVGHSLFGIITAWFYILLAGWKEKKKVKRIVANSNS